MKASDRARDSSARQKVMAVHEDDVKELLSKLGIIDQVEHNKIKCPICGQNITVQNVGLVYKKEGKLLIACNSSICLASARMEI